MVQTSLFEEPGLILEAAANGFARASFSSWLETPLGYLEIVSDGTNVLSIEFSEDILRGDPDGGDSAGWIAHEQLTEYFEGGRQEFTIPVRLTGTPFQLEVWRRLGEVSYGQTLCYSALAEGVGLRRGQRAVGMASRLNPLAIVVPCHRVIQADGALCGYAGGLWRKQQLLGLESGQRGLF